MESRISKDEFENKYEALKGLFGDRYASEIVGAGDTLLNEKSHRIQELEKRIELIDRDNSELRQKFKELEGIVKQHITKDDNQDDDDAPTSPTQRKHKSGVRVVRDTSDEEDSPVEQSYALRFTEREKRLRRKIRRLSKEDTDKTAVNEFLAAEEERIQTLSHHGKNKFIFRKDSHKKLMITRLKRYAETLNK